MPFVSRAQARKFFSDPKLRPFAKEWAAATPSIAALPERVSKMNPDAQAKHAKKHPKSRVRKPQHAQSAAEKGPIYQTAEEEGIAKRALRKA